MIKSICGTILLLVVASSALFLANPAVDASNGCCCDPHGALHAQSVVPGTAECMGDGGLCTILCNPDKVVGDGWECVDGGPSSDNCDINTVAATINTYQPGPYSFCMPEFCTPMGSCQVQKSYNVTLEIACIEDGCD